MSGLLRAGIEPVGELSRTTVKTTQKNTGRKLAERAAFNNVTNVVSETQSKACLVKDLSATFSPAKVSVGLFALVSVTVCFPISSN